jgi:hypothetical protein
MSFSDNSSPAIIVDKDGTRAMPTALTLSRSELRILTDYHYYEAEKAITRRGDRTSQQYHLERLATLRAATAKEQI